MERLELFLRENQDFSKFRHIQGRISIADIYSKNNRCGIYVLRFENGEVYVGQAKDVTQRYVQHRRTHDDITHISFKRVPTSRLNEEERSVIAYLEHQGFHLRNITFTSIPKGESDFDFVMPIDEQNRWIEELDDPALKGTRVQDETLRRKYQKRFEKFITKPYAEQSIDLMRRYALQGLPVPLKSEMAFWSCSCLPSYSGRGVIIYSRVNVNWQEVFTVCTVGDDLIFSFHLALTPLQAEYGESLALLPEKFDDLEVDDHFYEPGGYDQICVNLIGFDAVCCFLADPTVRKAIRQFSLNLMRKGPCNFSRYHCMDLADRLLAR